MFYFYPKIYYKVNSYDYIRVTDISVHAKIKDIVKSYGQTSARPYTVVDGESPDYVSYKIYGTPKYDYVVLLINDIRNYYDEWPMSNVVLTQHIENKFGSITNAQATYAKYFTSDGFEISKDAWNEQSITDNGAYRITNYENEVAINDEKSKIRLLNPNFVIKFEVELQQVISEIQTVQTP